MTNSMTSYTKKEENATIMSDINKIVGKGSTNKVVQPSGFGKEK